MLAGYQYGFRRNLGCAGGAADRDVGAVGGTYGRGGDPGTPAAVGGPAAGVRGGGVPAGRYGISPVGVGRDVAARVPAVAGMGRTAGGGGGGWGRLVASRARVARAS